MIRKWHHPDEGSGLPPGFQLVWMKIRGRKEVKLGLYDPNTAAWQAVDSTETLDVVLWTPLEEPPSTLRQPDGAVVVALKLASTLERAVSVLPSPWDLLDLEAAEQLIQEARNLRRST